MKKAFPSTKINNKDQDLLEFFFLSYFLYSYSSEILHVNVPYLGSAILGISAIFALLILIKKAEKTEYQLIILVVATSVIYLFVQTTIHDVPILARYNSPFLTWPILSLIILVLTRRPNFIVRLVITMFFISLIRRFTPILIDFAFTSQSSSTISAEIERVNSIAGWNAFCSIVLWFSGWKTNKKTKRILYWGSALIALFLMLEMTSRGALLALGIGMIFGLRNIPRKYWFSVIIGLSSIVFILSNLVFFNTYIQNYQARILEESGREELWTGSVDLMKAKPIFGYGTDLIGGTGANSPYQRIYRAPHNPFILIELSSGFLPLIPFLILWFGAFINSIRLGNKIQSIIDPFPLISCAFVYAMLSNVSFMDIWVIAATAYSYQLVNYPIFSFHRQLKTNHSLNSLLEKKTADSYIS